jgi:hypothetical protein
MQYDSEKQYEMAYFENGVRVRQEIVEDDCLWKKIRDGVVPEKQEENKICEIMYLENGKFVGGKLFSTEETLVKEFDRHQNRMRYFWRKEQKIIEVVEFA